MVYFFLANGFEEVEALAPLDLLRRAGVPVTTVAVGGGEAVVGTHGITVSADIPDVIYRDPAPEAVVLPGGMPGAEHLAASRTVASALKAASSCGGILAAICAAPMVLGRQGYLEGRRATCFPGFEKELKGAAVLPDRLVLDGKILTAKGMGVAMEFGFELVRLLASPEAAEKIRKAIQ